MSHVHVPTPDAIVLVGFMGAGKTTIGAALAERLGWNFVDLDQRIAERTGASPGRLIRERGEAAFRDLEAAETAELAGAQRLVLATGGGWATRPELAERMGSTALRVWLRVSPDEALRRAEADSVDRPLLGPVEGRRERVAELLQARAPFYGRAELVVDVDGREPASVVEEILAGVASHQERNER